MKNIDVWGLRINPLKITDIIKTIDEHISSTDKVFHLTGVNPETIAQSQVNRELRLAIQSSNLVNIDNMLVVLFLRLMGYKIPERAACPDIFEALLELSSKKGYSVYFLGAEEEVVNGMIGKLKLIFKNLNVVGFQNGYYKPEEEEAIIHNINLLNPDMLFIAFPTPRKELFIYRNKDRLNARFAFGVGGAFDVQAGKVKRAPNWMRRIGLEGIHRVLQNPMEYGTRYITHYLPFLRLALSTFLINRKSNKVDGVSQIF